MKTTIYYYIGIIIIGVISAVVIFSSMPADTWKDYRTEFTGVAPPDEMDEKIDCLSKGGIWDNTSCNFESESNESSLQEESERLSQVLRLCENTDAQYLGALSFENSTHHIDSQTCTWRLLDEN